MNEHQKAVAPAGLTLSDVLYIVFRHKWKIALISSLGFIAVIVVHFVLPHVYQSEAVLLIKYVPPSKLPDQVMATQSNDKPGDVGENVINTELEILTSQDLAQEVAASIGPEKLLTKDALVPGKLSAGPESETSPLLAAAGVVKSGLSADVKKRGTVIHVTFQHTDRAIVQPVLSKILEIYLKRHVQIHEEAGAIDEIWKKQTEQLGLELKKTEEELITAKTNANISSLEDDKRTMAQEISRIRDAIFDAESELAEREATVEEMSKLLQGTSLISTNRALTTNELQVPPTKLAEYKRICRLLDFQNRRAEEYELTYTPSNSLVREVRDQIAANERLKKRLELETPALLAAKIGEPRAGSGESPGARPDLVTERVRIDALKRKITVLNGQMAQLKAEAARMNQAEGPIKSLQIKKELEETRYRTMSANLDQSRIAEAVSAGHVWGIKPIQEPSPPVSAPSKRHKIMAMALFGPIAAAFALAFLIELYLDQSLKRPIEVETKLHLPLFLSIPRLKLNGKGPRLIEGPRRPLLREGNGVEENAPDHASEAVTADTQLTPWDPRNTLRPFHEALRDRLITHFELKNLTRKPKLVAVTACAGGSGVSTVAAGLAASLSETGEGNVLLVDMNQQSGAAHHFFHGDLACGLDDALEMEKRDSALVQDNLYVVMEGTDNQLPRILPKRFNTLVPRLKASDYDYIIFDMPPVSQISITPRVAKFMDMVLMVVESEKTDRHVVQRASSMLSESKTDVGIVLNKGRSYVPKRLQQEL